MRSPERFSPNLSKEERGVRGIESFAVNAEREDIAFRKGDKLSVYHRYATKVFPY